MQDCTMDEQLGSNAEFFYRMRKVDDEEKILVKVKKLLNSKYKPNIDAQDANDNNNTPLHIAIGRNHIRIIKFLLSQNIDATLANANNETPLDLAEKLNFSDEVVDAIKNYNRQPKPDDNGTNPKIIFEELDMKDTQRLEKLQKMKNSFKVLKLRNGENVESVLNFMLTDIFVQALNESTHWFIIAAEVYDQRIEVNNDLLKNLAQRIDRQRPFIIQWKCLSTEHCVLCYKNYQNTFETLTINDLARFPSEDDFVNNISEMNTFCLPILLKALSSNIGGELNQDLLKIKIYPLAEFDTWRLIDYATRDNDFLSLRLLVMLADWELKQTNGGGLRVLEIAAEFASSESLSAILDITFNYTGKEIFLNNDVLELQNCIGRTPLLIAAERGTCDILKLFINCRAKMTISHENQNNHQTAMQLAWEYNRYDNVCVLLEADDMFPKQFEIFNEKEEKLDIAKNIKELLGLSTNDDKVLPKTQNSENSLLVNFDSENVEPTHDYVALEKLIKIAAERNYFHEVLKDTETANVEKNKKFVENFIRSHPQLKMAYNTANNSARTTTILGENYDMHAFLQSRFFDQNKELQLTQEQNQALKEANLKYFRKKDNTHILHLLSKSRLGYGQTNDQFYVEISKIFEKMDEHPNISTMLKVIEHTDTLDIVFDFTNKSIVDLDPTHNSKTGGACDYMTGRIYIGAKQQSESELLGIVTHECSHLAFQVCHNNDCNPYKAHDIKTKEDFGEIVKEYATRKDIHNIISRVFTVYKNQRDWPSELIVRIPQLLALNIVDNSVESSLETLKTKYESLYSFYIDHSQKDFEKFITDPSYFKTQHKIQNMNDLLGQTDEIERLDAWVIESKEKAAKNDIIKIFCTTIPQLAKAEIYQQMKSNSELYAKSGCIFASIQHFTNMQNAQELRKYFLSTNKPYIVIDCTQHFETSKNDLRLTITSNFGKVLLITNTSTPEYQEEIKTIFKIKNLEIIHRNYKWTDLSTETQQKLLTRMFIFQRNDLKWADLIKFESKFVDDLPIADLLAEKILEIGIPSSDPESYNQDFYVHRIINEFDCADERPNPDFPVSTVGKPIFRYNTDTTYGLKILFEKMDQHKFILISDYAGMGKTTILTYLSKSMMKIRPLFWTLRISLSDHTDDFKLKVKENVSDFSGQSAIEFVISLTNITAMLDKKLFDYLLGHGQVNLMFDGFDEISPTYNDIVIKLLLALKETKVNQIWLTTRPHNESKLIGRLKAIVVHSLEPFSEDDQVEFLTKFWSKTLELKEYDPIKVRTFAISLVRKLEVSIRDRDKQFTGVPLQTRMLAEAFLEDFSFCIQNDKNFTLPSKLDLLTLFEIFLDKKYLIYVSEKNNPTVVNVATEDIIKILKGGVNLRKAHQQLAIKSLFPESEKLLLQNRKIRTISNEKLIRIGLAKNNGKITFAHRVFAEYFVADFLVELLKSRKLVTDEVKDFILKFVFLTANCEVIRNFINGFLGSLDFAQVDAINLEIRIEYLCQEEFEKLPVPHEKIEAMDGIVYLSASEYNTHIIDFILELLYKIDKTETIKKLLQYKGSRKQAAWHSAAEYGKMEVLGRLWFWGEKVKMNMEDILSDKDRSSQNMWNRAAQNGQVEIMKKLWAWGRQQNIDLKQKFLLETDTYGVSSWFWAAWKGRVQVMDELWSWAKEVRLEGNELRKVLFQKDIYGHTMWQMACEKGNIGSLYKLLEWGQELQLSSDDLKKEVLLHPDKDGNTVWTWAAMGEHLDILDLLWGWGKQFRMTSAEFLKILTHKNMNSHTIWHHLACERKRLGLTKIFDFAQDIGIDLCTIKKMFQKKDIKNLDVFSFLMRIDDESVREILNKLQSNSRSSSNSAQCSQW